MAKKGRIRRNSYFNTLFWPNILIIAVVISVLFCTFYIMLSNTYEMRLLRITCSMLSIQELILKAD